MKNNYSLIDSFVIFAMFCVGMYLVPIRILGISLTWIPGDFGDGRLNNYFLEHGYKWITGQVSGFWDAPFFYPAIRTMSYSDNHLGTLPLYAFFRFLQYDRETSYQLWLIAVFALNYTTCVWVLRKLSVSSTGAAGGAYVFTFSLPVISQLTHSQLMPRFMIPLAFYFALKYLHKPDLRSFSLTCFAIVAQFYCTIYMGFFLIIGLLAIFISYTTFHSSLSTLRGLAGGSQQQFLARVGVLSVSLLCLIPLMLPYYRTSLELGVRSWEHISLMLPRIASYFYPANGSLVWGFLGRLGNTLPMAHEHQIYIGAIPLLTFFAMPFLYHRYGDELLIRRGMFMFIVAVVIFCMTLYFGKSIYRFLLWIPGLRSIRAVSRIIFMSSFPIALILGIVMTKLSELKALPRYGTVILTSLVLFSVVVDQHVKTEALYRYSKKDAQLRSQKVERLVMEKDPAAKIFAYMPGKSDDPDYVVHIDAMMASQNLNIATVNGYSGNFPHGYYDHFFLHYDECDSLAIWKQVAFKANAQRPNKQTIFDGLSIAGRGSCRASDHVYSFMSSTLPEGGYKAKIVLPSASMTTLRGTPLSVPVRVYNESATTWGSLNDVGGRYQIKLSYRWLDTDRRPLGNFDARFALPYDVKPDESAPFSLMISPPDRPGTYFLEFDLVQELVTWFHERGSPTAILKIVVS